MVLDTNVLVSAVLSEGPPRKLLRRCIKGQDQLLASDATLAELFDVLRRPKFGLDEALVQRILWAVASISELVQTRTSVWEIRADPEDNRFLELAVEGRADLIVSGDRHLLELGSFRGIEISRAARALEFLRRT